MTPPGKTGTYIKLKLFSGIHLLLKVFCFEAFVNHSMGNSFMNKVQVGVIFDKKYFICSYQQLTAMLILLSILLIFDVRNMETYMQTSSINIFIGT